MIGYVAGPLLALLISLKFTRDVNKNLRIDSNKVIVELLAANKSRLDQRFVKLQENYVKLTAKVDLLERRVEELDNEMPQKIINTMMPIAKAVNKLNQQLGL